MHRLWRYYDALTTGLLALCGFAMFALAIGNAMLRYFFGAPLVWGEEISRYSMIWGTMIGIALAYRAANHVAITILVDAMPSRAVFVCRLMVHALSLATAYVIWRAGYVLVARLGFMGAPSSELQMAWVYAAFPVAAVMLAIEVLRHLVVDLRALVPPARS